MKRAIRFLVTLAAVAALGLGLGACPEKKKGPLEKAGEKMDRALDDAREQVGDALDKAARELEGD